MKYVIATFRDSGIANGWRWDFYLESTGSDSFTLSCDQIVEIGEPYLEAPELPSPVRDIRDGVLLYRALESMLLQIDYSMEKIKPATTSKRISRFSERLAQQFLDAPAAIEQEEEAAAERAALERAERLEPFREVIDDYLLKFSDAPMRAGGVGYPSQRRQMRQFIEDYVASTGSLPTGEHEIKVRIGGFGFSSGRHDFRDLGSR